MSIFVALISLSWNLRAEPAKSGSTGGAVLHLALIKSWDEHTNFQIAQHRLRTANPDRRIITMVRERDYDESSAVPVDRSLAALDADLRIKLTDLGQGIELVYIQLNDLVWMHRFWDALEKSAVAGEEIPESVITALRGHLAPNARVVVMGNNFLGPDTRRWAMNARRLMDYLGAPDGSLVTQVTPTRLPFEQSDFARNLERRLAVSAVKGLGTAALLRLGFDGLGWSDAATIPLVAGGIAALYRATVPVKATADTEAKPRPGLWRLPRRFGIFNDFDDMFFTSTVAFGTSALVHGLAHRGLSFLDQAYAREAVIGTGLFFIFTFVPKAIRNLRIAYLERTRYANQSRVYTRADGAAEARAAEIRSNDPRIFTCAAAFAGEDAE